MVWKLKYKQCGKHKLLKMPVLSVNVFSYKLTNIPHRGVTTTEAVEAAASSLILTFPSHKTILFPYTTLSWLTTIHLSPHYICLFPVFLECENKTCPKIALEMNSEGVIFNIFQWRRLRTLYSSAHLYNITVKHYNQWMGNSAGCIVNETLLGSINVSRRSVLVGLQFLSGTIDRYVTVSQFNTVVLRAPRPRRGSRSGYASSGLVS